MKTTEKSDVKTLNELFLNELADIYDAEHRIAKALPKMAKAAVSEDLNKAILNHLKETEAQAKKVEQVFKCFGEKPKSKTCKATVGLLEEGDEIAAEFKGEPSNDAALISALQKVEHYEIASYTSLREWATLLGNGEAAKILDDILGEEQHASQTLSGLASSGANEEALDQSEEEGESEELETKEVGVKKKAAAVKKAVASR